MAEIMADCVVGQKLFVAAPLGSRVSRTRRSGFWVHRDSSDRGWDTTPRIDDQSRPGDRGRLPITDRAPPGENRVIRRATESKSAFPFHFPAVAFSDGRGNPPAPGSSFYPIYGR
jgi:hypothetical protein